MAGARKRQNDFYARTAVRAMPEDCHRCNRPFAEHGAGGKCPPF